MATYNIEMNMLNENNNYDIIYPETNLKYITFSRIGDGVSKKGKTILLGTFSKNVKIFYGIVRSDTNRVHYPYDYEVVLDSNGLQVSQAYGEYIGETTLLIFNGNNRLYITGIYVNDNHKILNCDITFYYGNGLIYMEYTDDIEIELPNNMSAYHIYNGKDIVYNFTFFYENS